jgi:hypothetical protein
MHAFATTPGVQVATRLHHMMRIVNRKHHLLHFLLTTLSLPPDKGCPRIASSDLRNRTHAREAEERVL